MNIGQKRVLITGSNGFIGGHLAKRLVEFKGTRVRGLIKNQLIPTERIDGLPVERAFGDMTSLEAMRDATCGCDIVVHCAVGEPYENPIGTRNVIHAALEHGVKKFIHISSTAVFGYSPPAAKVKDGRLDYKYSKDDYHTAYSCSKAESERIAFSYYDSNKLPLVVLRLGNVFGPHSTCWTTRPIRMLEQGCYTLVNGGLTPSNAVYVDNVVDAIILAIEEDNAVGQALTICDSKTTNWKDFFSSYAKMLPTQPSLLGITQRDLRDERARQKVKHIKRMFSNPLQIVSTFQSLEKECDSHLLASLIEKTRIKQLAGFNPLREFTTNAASDQYTSNMAKLPEKWLEKTFTLPFQYSIKGASDVLGFKPRVSFEDGMKKTEKWLNGYSSAVHKRHFRNIYTTEALLSPVPLCACAT